ncbi:MAG: cysteine hydrolase family protein [Methylococcaceae bacterium]|nr:cysteine hydrolase family protein [Methylococcaceae bacterium]
MNANTTAIILIGYQNDYFLTDGVLHHALESTDAVQKILQGTVALINKIKDTPILVINTPIIFTETYTELINPIGILKTIKEVGAFKSGTAGSETIAQILAFADRIINVPGKRGLNAFSNTSLDSLLQEHNIKDVVLAGVVTSICLDTTGRTALDKGYNVTVLEDCTGGRSRYARVLNSTQLLEELN